MRPAALTLCASLGAAFLMLAACVTMRAGSDYYPETDFSSYSTYAWTGSSPLIEPRSRRVEISPLTVRRVREAIERELAAKGFERVETPEEADFGLSFTVGARDAIRPDNYPQFYRRGPWVWQPPYYPPNLDIAMYTEGMLAVDVFDNATRQPVWHGWARKQITGADVDDPTPAIDAAVRAILADFPPGDR